MDIDLFDLIFFFNHGVSRSFHGVSKGLEPVQFLFPHLITPHLITPSPRSFSSWQVAVGSCSQPQP